MKIKTDFVTNSSSSAFIISLPPEDYDSFHDYMEELAEHPEAQNEGVGTIMLSKTMKDLNEFTNGGPLDWIQKAIGRPLYEELDETHYDMCRKIIESEKNIAILCWIDNNVSEKFYDDNEEIVRDNYI